MATDPLDVARGMFEAIEAGDLEGLDAWIAPDVAAWANFDGRTKDLDAIRRILGWLRSKLPDLRYEEIRLEARPGGFLQRHVLRGTAADGTDISMPACIVATVDDGRVTAMDEYLDVAPLAVLQT
jgi:ketosteroid isomerase-like protein